MIKLKSNKGFTIVELILSLTIFSLIMLPVFYGFANAAKLNKLSRQQTRINAVVKQIKKDVMGYIKTDRKEVKQYDSTNNIITPPTGILRNGTNLYELDNIVVTDNSGATDYFYKDYKYKLSGGHWLTGHEKNVCEYTVTLKKLDGTKVLDFKMNVYKEN
jgi:prepilin-type N-terminal cleavage/methylation domain-containing protein